MPKRERSGAESNPARVVAPMSVNGFSSIWDRARAGAAIDHDVELVILHCRIEIFFNNGGEPMNSSMKSTRLLLKKSKFPLNRRRARAQDRMLCEFARTFRGDNMGECSFAESRRTVNTDDREVPSPRARAAAMKMRRFSMMLSCP